MITFLGSWIPGFLAAYFSYQAGMEGLQLLCLLMNLFAPFIAAMIMIYGSKNRELKKDFWDRLNPCKIKLIFLPVIIFLMPCVTILATAISLLFGKSIDQFSLSPEFAIMSGHGMISLLILFLAPMFEELGWRGYGVDSLRSRYNLMQTTILFASLWALWHVPLFFIHGYYQNILWQTSIIYVANFFMSMPPAAVLLNWLYYKNDRNIIAVILLHFMLNLSSVLLQTEQFSKCIITMLLLFISAIIIAKNKKFFFTL